MMWSCCDATGSVIESARAGIEADQTIVVDVEIPKRTKGPPVGIVVAGAPGSGKGTQSAHIRRHHGLVHLSSGALLRRAVASGSAVGKKVKPLMEQGLLVPHDIVVAVVTERLEQDDVQENGFILDGFPRRLIEARALEEKGFSIDLFVLLEVPENVVIERITGRRVDPKSGISYHIKFDPPPANVQVVRRNDDTEEKIRVRLEEYKKNIEEIKAFYGSRVVQIDGVGDHLEVFARVNEALSEVVVKREPPTPETSPPPVHSLMS